jgi:hypothetical protein
LKRKVILFLQLDFFTSVVYLNNPNLFLEIKNMIDNINKLSAHIDTNKQQQQTAASIVNLTDDGKILVLKSFFFFPLLTLIRNKK